MTGTDTPAGVRVREATVPELPAVLNVLDGGALQTDSGRVRSAIDRGDVLVAVAGDEGERVVGALVLDGAEIRSVAVRRRRRGQGIGSALVGAAATFRERLVAEFDPGVRPFWDAVGFDVTPVETADASPTERFRGVYRPD